MTSTPTFSVPNNTMDNVLAFVSGTILDSGLSKIIIFIAGLGLAFWAISLVFHWLGMLLENRRHQARRDKARDMIRSLPQGAQQEVVAALERRELARTVKDIEALDD